MEGGLCCSRGSAAVSSRLRFVELTMSWTSISCSSENVCAERTSEFCKVGWRSVTNLGDWKCRIW